MKMAKQWRNEVWQCSAAMTAEGVIEEENRWKKASRDEACRRKPLIKSMTKYFQSGES